MIFETFESQCALVRSMVDGEKSPTDLEMMSGVEFPSRSTLLLLISSAGNDICFGFLDFLSFNFLEPEQQPVFDSQDPTHCKKLEKWNF